MALVRLLVLALLGTLLYRVGVTPMMWELYAICGLIAAYGLLWRIEGRRTLELRDGG